MTDDKVGKLVRGAYVAGHMSKESLTALQKPDIAGLLAQGLASQDFIDAEMLLVTAVVDDSGSISQAHQESAIREGHNRLLAVLKSAESSAHILVTTRLLNGTVINPFRPVEDARDLTTHNYDPARFGGTPLYHQAVATLGTVMLQTQALEEMGCDVRAITLIITDGLDESQYVTGRNNFKATYSTPASDVAFMAGDMHRSGNHLLAAYAVGVGTELKTEFTKMGIKPGWILTSPDALASLLRFANEAVRASLSKASFQRLLERGGFDSE